MGDATNMGNVPGIPVPEAPNQMPSNGQGHQSGSGEAIPVPPPGISVPPPNDPTPPNDRNPRITTPTGLRDFEGRRLYFANVCNTVSPHALHCIFRSYGPIRTFHYDTSLHYGYVVYLEREQALLARYGVDGLILGSRAIRVYYPPFKPRHPTRFCYNCREMGHFIQSCPYTNCNNWEYNYSPLYNQGQPILDQMNHPSAPMMQHFPGPMIAPPSQFMYPTIPGQPGGSATLMYQPGWPNVPFMPPFMGPVQQPMPPQPQPVMQQPMHLNHQLMNQQPSAPPMPPYPVQPYPQLHPNLSAMIQEQAAAIIQQHIPPMVQQVVNQIMQDPAMNHLQQLMMQQQQQQQNTVDPQTLRSGGSYTVNEEPDSASLQSGSMTMQHGSYTAMEEPRAPAMQEPRAPAMPQNVLAHLMQNLPMQDMDLGKMMQYAAQTLLQDGSYAKESRCEEVEESVNCCPVHNTPMTKVQKPATTSADNTATPATTPRSAETVAPPEPQTRNTSSTESGPNTAEEPTQSVDNQYYPQYPQYQAPFSLPSSIFFTLPPIVVNITSPAPYMSPNGSTTDQPKPPPTNPSESYDFVQENERNLREFEEVVRDDEQNYVENEENIRAQMSEVQGPVEIPKEPSPKDSASNRTMKNNETPPPQKPKREWQRQDLLRAMLMDGNGPAESNAATMPANRFDLSLKDCLDKIQTKSDAEILKMSQQLLHKIVDQDKLTDKVEILKLSNDLLEYASQKKPSTSAAPAEGAVGGKKAEEIVESSRSECDSRKDDSDDGNYRRKNHWKKNKKRRR